MRLEVLVKLACPIKNTHQFRVGYSQEALPDVKHNSQQRILRRPTI